MDGDTAIQYTPALNYEYLFSLFNPDEQPLPRPQNFATCSGGLIAVTVAAAAKFTSTDTFCIHCLPYLNAEVQVCEVGTDSLKGKDRSDLECATMGKHNYYPTLM